MSTSRHLLLLSRVCACAPALVLSCASRPQLAPSQPALSDPPHWSIESELRASDPRAAEPLATNPYTPTRSLDSAVYSWQNDRRAECPPESSARQPALETGAARALLAAFPERPSDLGSSALRANPDHVVLALRPALHHCFSRWLNDHADAQGSVRFALELGCAGDVAAISAENQGVDESTLACLFSAVAPARFAPPAGGHATVLVPIVFKNAAR